MRDHTQRQYTYLKQSDRAHEEVLGQMKKRVASRVQLEGPAETQFAMLKDPSRQQLAKKIVENYEAVRSVLPYERRVNPQGKQNIRPSSIKIVKRQEPNGLTGASYLINKSEVRGPGHSEKKHVVQCHAYSLTKHEKKHFNKASEMGIQSEAPKGRSALAMQTKVINDFMSSIPDNDYFRSERPTSAKQRRPMNTMLRTSYEMGYEQQKKTNISQQKKAEISGNGLDKEPVNLKVRRDDFRRSSIIFG